MGFPLGEVISETRAGQSLRSWDSDLLNTFFFVRGEWGRKRASDLLKSSHVKREREQERYNKWHNNWSHVIAKELLQ